MYVCICNAIRDSEIKQAARAFAGDAEELYRTLGKEVQCGLCLDDAAEVIAAARNPAIQAHFV